MPSFAQGQYGQPYVVAGVAIALELALKAAGAEHVRQRVDGEGRVPERHGGHEKAAHQRIVTAAEKVAGQRQQHARQQVPAVQGAQLRVSQQVGHQRAHDLGVRIAQQKPPEMAPPEAATHRRVGVPLVVGVLVVMPVPRCPPQNPLLARGGAQHRQHELKGARRLERAVRKVAVIPGGDAEHAQAVREHAQPASRWARSKVQVGEALEGHAVHPAERPERGGAHEAGDVAVMGSGRDSAVHALPPPASEYAFEMARVSRAMRRSHPPGRIGASSHKFEWQVDSQRRNKMTRRGVSKTQVLVRNSTRARTARTGGELRQCTKYCTRSAAGVPL
eukprot:ctg_1766.g540